MADAFKKGDVVVLKSGGMPMTVKYCPGEGPPTRMRSDDDYLCVWHHGAKSEAGAYPEHVLEQYDLKKKL